MVYLYNMEASKPNKIKDYYIAYFDILGYRKFFENNPDKAEEFLSMIHSVVNKTMDSFIPLPDISFLKDIFNYEIEIKIFSDNFLICMEVKNHRFEKARIAAFLMTLSNIQRGFVNEYGLFVRGGICIGQISFNKDFVFGEGIIKVVEMEEKANYPRIVVEPSLIDKAVKLSFVSEGDTERGIQIEKLLSDSPAVVSNDERKEYFNIRSLLKMNFFIDKILSELFYRYYDGVVALSYMANINFVSLMNSKDISCFIELLKSKIPLQDDFSNLKLRNYILEDGFESHRNRIIEKINEHGSYDWNESYEDSLKREKVLKKYVYSMKYHNDMCDKYSVPQYFINSEANVDAKYMLLTVRDVELTESEIISDKK